MHLFQKSIYYTEQEREQHLRQMFVNGVKQGINDDVLLALAMLPELQNEKFKMDTNKLNDDVKKAFFHKNTPQSMFKERQKQPDYPAETEVNFSYFLLKNNQSELLKKIISSDSEQPFVTPPYQRLNVFGADGREKMYLIFHKDHNGEPFTREQGLQMIRDGKAVDFSKNEYSQAMAHSLPNYLKPIHQNEVAKQLRFLYHLDGNVQKLTNELFKERGINLVASYPSIIPDPVNPKTSIDDILGLGESMDSDWWKDLQAKRAEYEALHKDELQQGSANYQTTVKNVWKDDGSKEEPSNENTQATSKAVSKGGGRR